MQTRPVTEKIIDRLCSIADGEHALSPTTLAIEKVKIVLIECEKCRLPLPSVTVLPTYIRLFWASPSREIQLDVDKDGDIIFETAIKELDRDGEVIAVLNADGSIEGPRGIDRMLAWFFSGQSALC